MISAVAEHGVTYETLFGLEFGMVEVDRWSHRLTVNLDIESAEVFGLRKASSDFNPVLSLAVGNKHELIAHPIVAPPKLAFATLAHPLQARRFHVATQYRKVCSLLAFDFEIEGILSSDIETGSWDGATRGFDINLPVYAASRTQIEKVVGA